MKKVLWVDDDANELSGIAEGFIKESTFSENGRLKGAAEHYWMKLGDHYEQKGNPVHDLADKAKDYISKIDDSEFGDIEDNNDTLKRAIEKMKEYNIVMLDLFLMKEDNDIISLPNLEKPMLSMKIYHALRTDEGNNPTVKLYSTYSATGKTDDSWVAMYNSTCNSGEDPIDPFIYARKSLSAYYSGQYSKFREDQLVNEIMDEE